MLEIYRGIDVGGALVLAMVEPGRCTDSINEQRAVAWSFLNHTKIYLSVEVAVLSGGSAGMGAALHLCLIDFVLLRTSPILLTPQGAHC